MFRRVSKAASKATEAKNVEWPPNLRQVQVEEAISDKEFLKLIAEVSASVENGKQVEERPLRLMAGCLYKTSRLELSEQLCIKNVVSALRDILSQQDLDKRKCFFAVSILFSISYFPALKVRVLSVDDMIPTLNACWFLDQSISEKIASMYSMHAYDLEPAKILCEHRVHDLAIVTLFTSRHFGLLQKCMLLILRLSFHEDCLEPLNNSSAAPVVKSFLQLKDHENGIWQDRSKWGAAVLLANLMASLPNEQRFEFEIGEGVLRTVQEMLKGKAEETAKKKTKSSEDTSGLFFSLQQIVSAVRNLALDSNAASTLADLGVVDLLLAVLGTPLEDLAEAVALPDILVVGSKDEATQKELEATLGAVVKALWTLAFNKNVAMELLGKDVVPLLEKVSEALPALRVVVDGAIFEIEKSSGKRKEPEIKRLGDMKHDVMISYNWNSQQLALEIKAGLERRGFSVWMDVEKMHGGSMLDLMADAVESSAVILVVMTNKYYLSNACHSEADYAYALKKPLCPVLAEDFKPRGWLGLLLGMQKYVDFTDLTQSSRSMDILVTEVSSKMGVDVPVSADPGPSSHSSPNTLTDIASDVKQILSILENQ